MRHRTGLSVLLAVLLLTPMNWQPVFAKEDLAKKHFDASVNFYLKNNFEEAIKELNWCLAIDSDYPPANKFLPVLLRRKDVGVELSLIHI